MEQNQTELKEMERKMEEIKDLLKNESNNKNESNIYSKIEVEVKSMENKYKDELIELKEELMKELNRRD